jgi:soluble lytic murein transglycosylase-like protein
MLYDAEVAAALNQAGRYYSVTPDAALVHAIIQRETSHAPYSAQGTPEPNGHHSYGPMQVEDSTAAMHGVSDPTTLSIASVGIRIGTFELARLLSLFPDDTERAVAAYNAGPGNAVRSSDTGDFPNQSYVDAVMNFWNQYSSGVAVAAGPALGVIAFLVIGLLLVTRRRQRFA